MSLGGGGAEVWGWRGERMTGLILDTWKTGWIFLKGGVNLSRTVTGLRTLEMMNGPNEFGSQFTWGESEVKVLRGQPDLLTAHVKWGLSTVTVRWRFVPLASPGEGFSGGPPSTEASLNKRMRGRNNSVGFLGGE